MVITGYFFVKHFIFLIIQMLDNIVERESTEWKIMCIIICYFILLSFLFLLLEDVYAV